MRKFIHLTLVLLIYMGSGKAQTTLISEGFETNGEGTRYFTNTYLIASPTCDFFERSTAVPLNPCFGGVTFSNFQGSFFWGSEDIMSSPGNKPPGSIITQSVSILGYSSLNVSLFLATSNNVTPTNTRWETADSINVKVSLDGGLTYKTVGRFMGTAAFGGDLIVDANLNGIADASELSGVASLSAFTKYTFPITGGGTSLRVWIDFDQLGGSEELGIDQIEVTGILSCSSPTLSVVGQNNVLCNGGSTGSATVSASGGAPFTYTWSPSGGNAANASVLSAGIYTCVVTNSCGLTASQTVNITQPTAVAGSTAVTNALCNGANGSATITLSGGTAPYTYTWSSGPTSSVEPTLLAGTYTVRGTDANGCSITRSVTVTQPTAINTSTAAVNVLCFGNNTGSATITANGGTGSYTYLWSSAQTTSIITGLNAAVRTVTVTDANGCKATNTVVINQPASALNTSTAITNVLCFGGSTGAATVTASGGTAGYTYLWSSAQTTSVITGINAGVRTVTVTDANGCTSVKNITISQPASALNTSTAITNVLCFGNSTGAATVTASGGTGGYTYLWSSAQTTSVITGLNAGVKTVTVTDANNCVNVNTVTVSQPASAISTSTAAVNVLCFGNSTGAATVTASGGTAGYTYLWSSAQTTSVITGLNAGVRTVTVTDANGCTSVKNITISQPASALNTSTAITNVLCFGNSTGAATVTASGGTAGYTYLWSTAATTSVITGQNAGVKTVTVTDANGCVNVNTVTISQPVSAISTSVTSTTAPGCGLTNGAITISANGGTGTLTYSWSPTGGSSSTASGLGAGSYTCFVVDANNCSVSISQSLSNPNSPSVAATSTNAGCAGQTNGNIVLNVSGGTPGYTYSWSPSVSTTSIASTLGAGVYNATVTDASNCKSSQSFTLTAFPLPTVTANNSNPVICMGSSVTLSGSGALTYTWSSGVIDNTAFTPTSTSSYTVTGANSNGCTNTAVTSVTVNSLPTINATTSSSLICTLPSQQSATLTGNGATTYTWNPGGSGTSIVISPSVTTTYTVSGTDANGCENSAIITQSVSLCTGFSQLQINEDGINVFPNPNGGVFNIRVTQPGIYSLINSLGQKINLFEVKTQYEKIEVRGLSTGIYYVVGGGVTRKVVVEIE